ncbi:MAG: HAMP domain-containing sensor histidine kinase [Candidatus Orphnella occulta]|nr:HAMP domain-containing sensor histidine kinase [Candidatus Orphnella occulta]
MVEVEDTGFGIPKENMDKVFDAFFTIKGPKEGAGLGLSIVKNIVELHNALIEVDSEVGRGTRISITLKPVNDK